MRLETFANYGELSEAAADVIQDVLDRRDAPVLGLATGSTPVGVYRELVRRCRRGLISFRRAHIFHLDEFHPIRGDHPASFRQFLKEQLIDHIDCPPEQVHFLDGEAVDPAEEAARYEREIQRAGGIHLQILGIGPNGHVAFNEPGSPRDSRTRRVRLHEASREHNRDAFTAAGDGQVPTHALTMGLATIMEARTLLLLATGAGKARILERALTGQVSPEVPASLLRDHNDLQVLADGAAAGRLASLGEKAQAEARGREHSA